MRFENKRSVFTANIYGFNLEIGTWAKYAAINADGSIILFGLKPLIDSEVGVWTGGGRWEMLPVQAHFDSGDNWMNTLIELEDSRFMKLEKV